MGLNMREIPLVIILHVLDNVNSISRLHFKSKNPFAPNFCVSQLFKKFLILLKIENFVQEISRMRAESKLHNLLVKKFRTREITDHASTNQIAFHTVCTYPKALKLFSFELNPISKCRITFLAINLRKFIF